MKTREHAKLHPNHKSKWCSICKAWIGNRGWTSHQKKHPAEDINMRFFKHVPATNPVWRPVESGVEVAWNPSQEKYSKLEAEYKAQERKLRFLTCENKQLRLLITEIGRALVTTYAEY